MKIALVNHSFSLSHGGLERVSVNLASVLQKAGHEIHVFAHRWEDLPEGIAVHPVEVASKPAFWRVCSFVRNVRRQLAAQPFDLVYGLTRIWPLDLYRLGDGVHRHWMQLRYPQPVWRWINYLINPVHLVNLLLERRILRSSRCCIITNSYLVKKHVEDYYPVSQERIHVVYNGVNHQVFSPENMAGLRNDIRRKLGFDSEKKVLLYVSNNWKRKGLATIIRALANPAVSPNHYHLVVVGRGRPRRFTALAARCGVAEKMTFVAPTREIQRYYAAADLLVLPTRYDPFANVCLEAMASGVPVITTRENGAAELVEEGQSGFLLDRADDHQQLAKYLGDLAQKNLRTMGLVAHRKAAGFTYERHVQQTVNVFQQCADLKKAEKNIYRH